MHERHIANFYNDVLQFVLTMSCVHPFIKTHFLPLTMQNFGGS